METIGDAYLATTNLLKEQVIQKIGVTVTVTWPDTTSSTTELRVHVNFIVAYTIFLKAGNTYHDKS